MYLPNHHFNRLAAIHKGMWTLNTFKGCKTKERRNNHEIDIVEYCKTLS